MQANEMNDYLQGKQSGAFDNLWLQNYQIFEYNLRKDSPSDTLSTPIHPPICQKKPFNPFFPSSLTS